MKQKNFYLYTYTNDLLYKAVLFDTILLQVMSVFSDLTDSDEDKR